METVLELLADDCQTNSAPLCPRCAGTGWELVSSQDMTGVRRCRDASHLQELLDKSRVPKTHAHCTLENFYARTPAQSRSLSRAEYFAGRLNRTSEGLWISGSAASGKTHLAVGIVSALLARGQRGIRFYHAAELLRALDPRGPAAHRGRRALLCAEAARAKLLVLDDLGGTALSPTEMDRLNDIIDIRERAALPVLVTTRCRKVELSRSIGSRASFAIAALCAKLSLWGERGGRPDKESPFNRGLEKLWDQNLA